ncbi:hypothetical protein MHYP_G00173400 [Metynnis hypsauchen]
MRSLSTACSQLPLPHRCSQQFGLLSFYLFSIRSFDVTAGPPVVSLQVLLSVRLKMEFVVNCDVFLYLLVCRLVVSTQAVIFSQSKTEGRDVILGCVNEGKVTWGKGTDGGRSDILTAEDGEITQKHRPDPENRYSVLTDLSLVIKSVALSDSGIYYCNSAPAVNLSVNPAPSETVSSSRPTTERRTDALLTTASSVLHTESTTTTTGGVSVVESVLMFGGVGLAALMFLLATVAAGRVILHQNRQTGWTAGKEFVQLSPSDGEEDPSSQ